MGDGVWTRGLSVLSALALAASCTDAGGSAAAGLRGSAAIAGAVRDPFTSEPLADAVVTLERDGDAPVTARTDPSGWYAFDALAPGAYDLVVVADGHFTARRAAVRVDGRDDTRADFELPPVAPTDDAVRARLLRLAEAQAFRDDPSDPALRPEARAMILAERRAREGAPHDAIGGPLAEARDPRALPEVPRREGHMASGCSSGAGTPPDTIRIWRRENWNTPDTSCSGRVDVIPFEAYIKGVLPHEWIPSWHRESLRAGSLAIRTYSWRWVRAGGKYRCADLDDTIASQRYEDMRLDVTNQAVDATRGLGIFRAGALVSGEYSAENANPTADGVSDPLCAGHPRFGHGRGMCQWGSHRWGVSGRTHVWIATHYWPGSSVGGNPDRDDDGTPDCRDNCPREANREQNDADRDGVGDACDNCRNEDNHHQSDTDRDGRGDACDNCPREANGEQGDDDRDGVGNACDNCRAVDNRGQTDTDRDGRGDACDGDDDDDGVPDAVDNCPLVANASQRNTDMMGGGDACDGDDDGDTVPDARDNCPRVPNRDQANLNGDAEGDACDDTDMDSVVDARDNCPRERNAGQTDTDMDTRGDACDADLDGDGVANERDNCELAANADQADGDQDATGDACDADRDGDGVENGADNCPASANADQGDADRDGVGDACDATPGSYPDGGVDGGAFVPDAEYPPDDVATDAGMDARGGPGREAGGCGCRAAGATSRRGGATGERAGGAAAVALGLALAAAGTRRRRRAPPSTPRGG